MTSFFSLRLSIPFRWVFVICTLFCSSYAFAQVGIGTSTPNASAALDVTSTNRGFLSPRYTTAALSNIANPAKGLLVYDSTRNGFYVYSGTAWVAVGDNLGTHEATQNIKLNSNYISANGANNGIRVDAAGKVIMTSAAIASGGAAADFLVKTNSSGDLGFRKGNGGLGMNYIIATVGVYPSRGGNPTTYGDQILGEVRLFAGNFAPDGWAFCAGQTLPINSNAALFSLLGVTYGGNGTTDFKLPDLRGAVPVHPGSALPSGSSWLQGERTN